MKNKSIIWMSVLIILGTPILVTLLFRVETNIGKERALKRGTEVRTELRGERGIIYSAEGAVLARSDTLLDAFLDCKLLCERYRDTVEWIMRTRELSPLLAEYFHQTDSVGWLNYMENGRIQGNRYLPIVKGVSKAQIETLKTFPIFNLNPNQGGGIIEPRYIRTYPLGQVGRRTIGYIKDDSHCFGLERSFDYCLAGRDGYKTTRYGRYDGRPIESISEYAPAYNGMDIVTTLSKNMSCLADSVLYSVITNNKTIDSGSLIIADVQTGAIRVMSNLTKTEDGVFETYNNAIRVSYEPANIAYLMTYAALLSDNHIDFLSDSFIEEEPLKMVEKYYSSNPQVYVNHLLKYCQNYEFDLDGLSPSRVPMPGTTSWRDDSITSISKGYNISLPALSLLSFFNAIANDGVMMKPYLVEKIIDNGDVIKTYGPNQLDTIMPINVAEKLLKGIEYSTRQGVERKTNKWSPMIVGIKGVSKTNTKNSSLERSPQYVESFVGYFPANQPKFSVICVLYSTTSQNTSHRKLMPESVVSSFVEQL